MSADTLGARPDGEIRTVKLITQPIWFVTDKGGSCSDFVTTATNTFEREVQRTYSLAASFVSGYS